MIKISDSLALRPVREDEADYWREVFIDSVRAHFDALDLPPGELEQLLNFQFDAQKTDYRQNYPLASNDVIMVDGERVGRVIHSTEHRDLHLIDLAVLSGFRGRGIGTEILKFLIDKSCKTGLPVRFYVEKVNPARGLYERLGFRVVADVITHFQMEWRRDT